MENRESEVDMQQLCKEYYEIITCCEEMGFSLCRYKLWKNEIYIIKWSKLDTKLSDFENIIFGQIRIKYQFEQIENSPIDLKTKAEILFAMSKKSNMYLEKYIDYTLSLIHI